jgi:hypothetical protein
MNKPILCLDFDGVIHSYTSGWKGAAVIPDDPVPGALEFIVGALVEFRVAIFSSRSHQWGGRRAMKRWLAAHLNRLGNGDDVPPWWMDRILMTAFSDPWSEEVAFAADLVVSEIEWPFFKPPALIAIDDRCLTFNGTWPPLSVLRSFKPWNKRQTVDLKNKLKLGATGDFPDGKRTPGDEGELRLAVSSENGRVRVGFGKPVAWFVLSSNGAKELAADLLRHAGGGGSN